MIKLIKNKLKARLRSFVLATVREDLERTLRISDQISAFRTSSERERQGYHDRIKDPEALKKRFRSAGIPVEDAEIDLDDFDRWLAEFHEVEASYREQAVQIEKCLEHYLAFKWLAVSKDDTYIDIAASCSVWSDALNDRGYRAYRLDIAYPKGIAGRRIGADAGDTGLPAGFAKAMSLQCAFETFKGDADVRFIQEADRILAPGGRLVVVPLYADDTYHILSSPYVDLSGIEFDRDALRVWREDEYKEPFSRHYSPEAFFERVYSRRGGMRAKVVCFTNLEKAAARHPGQRIYCHFLFYCGK